MGETMAARTQARLEPSARYEQRRMEVLRAAARTFNRRGFHIATLDDVADELGVYAEVICGDFGRCLVLTEPRDLALASRKIDLAGRRALNLAVREIIREGMAGGEFRPCDDRALAIALFDAFNGLAKWVNPNGAMPLEAIVAQYLDFFLHGVVREARQPGRLTSQR
ncbi:MAG: hypothetical protein ABSD80_14730 [Caulobacteraceae bacterium]